MSAWLERQWYRLGLGHLLLLPLSFLFWLLVTARRWLYRLRLLAVVRLPVPVVVVGNITVGGSGKTPLVLWLAERLRAAGMHPGIVSRGFGRTALAVREVTAQTDPMIGGDEPVLLARNSGCPVWIGADRVAAARALLAAHPECDCILSDDGLQHYRLGRDVEIAVVDGVRRFGNGLPLPAGPLREPVSRLADVDAVVVNGGDGSAPKNVKAAFVMQLQGAEFYNLLDPTQRQSAEALCAHNLHAVAGIAHPARFFAHLRGLGLKVREHPFPDHHVFQEKDLAFPGLVLMTEKDAVKSTRFGLGNCWVLAVKACVADELAQLVIGKVRK